MSRNSLRLRLLAAGTVAILLALAAAAAGLLLLFERHVTRRIDAELGVHLTQLIAGLDAVPDAAGGITLLRRPAEPRFERPYSGLYWQIVVERGQQVLRSRSLWDTVIALPQDELQDGVLHQHVLPGPNGSRLHVIERRAALSERLGQAHVRVAVAVDAGELDRATRDFAVDLLPVLAALAALLLAAGWVQVSVGLSPLANLRDRLAEVQSGRVRRLGRAYPDEVRPLAEEVDALLDLREGELEKARQRAADLAHGLKTPLQVLIGEARRLATKGDTDAAREITDLAETMQRHIERELRRARLAPASFGGTAEIASVAERVVGVVRRTPDGARLSWSIDVDQSLVARVDADDLAEALGNLIENAARFARSRVAVSAKASAAEVTIMVADDGAGISEEALADVVKRGSRVEQDHDGSGLGLAIAAEIAASAGGALALRNTGQGLHATLRFNRA